MRYEMLILVASLALIVPCLDAADADGTTHTVTFQMPDGTVLATQEVPDGGYVDISKIPNPPVPAGAVFQGWGDVTQKIVRDTVFTAMFSYPTETCTVRYFAEDRTTLMHTERVVKGSSATYDAIPVKNPSDSYMYTFERWSSDLSAVTADVDVYPIFRTSERTCEVRFFDYDRSLITVKHVPYGKDLTDMPANPSRAPTIGYTYEFECWSITPNGKSPVSFRNITDTRFAYAFYEPTLAEYTVTFRMGDQVLKRIVADYNSQVDASVALDLREGYLAKLFRDPQLTREYQVGFTVIGDTDVHVSLIPGIYSSDRGVDGKVLGNTVRVSHDRATIAALGGHANTICDISQFPSGTVAELDYDSLALIRETLGGDAVLRISVPRGTMEITASALCELCDGQDLSITISNGPSSVKITSALKKLNYSAYYNLSMKVGGRSVTALPDGIRLSFPLSAEEGQNPMAWGISSKGSVSEFESEYANGMISFILPSMQYIVLGTDAPGQETARDRVVLPYGTAEYEISGSGSVYGLADSPQSKLVRLSGDFKGNILFVPSSFDNRPLTHISADAFAGAVDAGAIVIPITVKTFEWMDWSCTTRDVYFLGDRPEFIGAPPSYVELHSFSGRAGWSGEDTEVHDRYTYSGAVGKDPFSFRFAIIGGDAYVDRYIAGSYIVLPRSVVADGREYKVAYIGDAAFMNTANGTLAELYGLEYDSYSLSTMEIPSTVTEIMTLAFHGSTIANLHGGESILHIWDGAFRNCSSLTPVNLHGSLLYIGDDAFLACSSKAFSRIAIPQSVEYIGSSAFYGCSGLTNVSLDCRISVIPDSCFAQCSSLTNITIPDSVVTIGDSAFYNCSNMLYIDLMNVETVGKSAFQCTGRSSYLDCVVFGDRLRSLGANAFAGCSDLAELEVYCGMPSGMDGAFNGADWGSIKVYALSSVAGEWPGFNVELLDTPEDEPSHTMAIVVIGMIVFFVIAGYLSFKYRIKFERSVRTGKDGNPYQYENKYVL